MPKFEISFSHYKQDYLFWQAKLNLERGKKYALIGEIGDGKTTLFEIIAGLQKNWQGTIDGVNQKEVAVDYSVSFLPSKPVLFENKSVFKNLEFACKVCGMNKPYDNVISMALKEFEIENLKEIKVKKLTFAQKQQVAFARSFIKNPQVVLIDDLLLNKMNNEEFEIVSCLIGKMLSSAKCVIVASTGYIDDKHHYDKFLTIENKQIFEYTSADELMKKHKQIVIRNNIETEGNK